MDGSDTVTRDAVLQEYHRFNLWLKPRPCALCGNFCVSLRPKDIQHIAQRGKYTALEHIEDSGSAAADQCDTLFILGNRLLRIAALDIPEYHPGKRIAGFRENFLCVLEIGQLCPSGAAVKLHVGDDI